MSAAPLASILIRSMDRPSLQRAIDSAAAQTWPNVEIVVVAACGAAHRPLPGRAGRHALRLVSASTPLSRPEAANVALEAAHGEWLNFLDDDDELLPDHLGTLLAVADPARARVVFARAHVRDETGRQTGHIGFAGFPVQLYFQNRSHPAATSFHRSLVAEGARFDTDFAVYEDHDFFVNCATRTAFQFVDRTTCIWNAHVGESGCGHGRNSDEAQRERYMRKLRAKWASFFAPLLREPETLLTIGQQYLRNAEPRAALEFLERALGARPGDINALNLCGLANLEVGDLARAERLLREAAQRLPGHPGIRQNLQLLQRRRAAKPSKPEAS